MEQQELIPHLFRTEYRKIVSVLCKRFGLEQIAAAEDIAGETFLTAAQHWAINGLPREPVAWMYTVAKNKAKNYLHRSSLFQQKIIPALIAQGLQQYEPEIDLSEKNVYDSQLQMMFAICHPAIPATAQIALALRLLCGFGIEEIANAFLCSKETITKRLSRGKARLRTENVRIQFPPAPEIDKRLASVLTTLYLLFNEGYYSETNDAVLQEDICLEAMRLTQLLLEHEQTRLPQVNALLALMCFHASRFEARKNNNGEMILYADQDENCWNYALISKGAELLQCASQGQTISTYHLEASIAYWHTKKTDTKEKWENILQLYNQLLQISYSPIAALNRTYALSRANSRQEGIKEAEKLKLTGNPYYFTLLAELYTGLDNKQALAHLQTAWSLAKSTADKNILSKRIVGFSPMRNDFNRNQQ
ncbi:MAG: sigma-70 family RNA polymerase sigma factor [Chitinophagaceae bacterium]